MGDEPFNRTNYETLDYVLTPTKWKNAIKNVESDIRSGISSDHCPIWARISINLKAKYEKKKTRWGKCKIISEKKTIPDSAGKWNIETLKDKTISATVNSRVLYAVISNNYLKSKSKYDILNHYVDMNLTHVHKTQ